MDEEKLDRERERALRHPVRRALWNVLDGGEYTLSELGTALPDAPSLSTVAYHLSMLQEVELVACAAGVYRERLSSS